MPSRLDSKSAPTSAPLYRDILEFIDVMGIKHTRVYEAFNISRSYWFKVKKQHLSGLSLENMHHFANYFDLPPEKVITLCYMTYVKGLAQAQSNGEDSEVKSVAEPAQAHIDVDFPPIG